MANPSLDTAPNPSLPFLLSSLRLATPRARHITGYCGPTSAALFIARNQPRSSTTRTTPPTKRSITFDVRNGSPIANRNLRINTYDSSTINQRRAPPPRFLIKTAVFLEIEPPTERVPKAVWRGFNWKSPFGTRNGRSWRGTSVKEQREGRALYEYGRLTPSNGAVGQYRARSCFPICSKPPVWST